MRINFLYGEDVLTTEGSLSTKVSQITRDISKMIGFVEDEVVLKLEGKRLDPNFTLSRYGIKADDLIIIELKNKSNSLPKLDKSKKSNIDTKGVDPNSYPSSYKPSEEMSLSLMVHPFQSLREVINIFPTPLDYLAIMDNHPDLMLELDTIPELKDATLKRDIPRIKQIFHAVYTSVQQSQAERREYERLMRLGEQDPYNVEVQRKIEEIIQKENIERNRELAMDILPESFTKVEMLYIPLNINGVTISAFVDSGAQSSIMDEIAATKCNLMHLIDRNFQGTAVGVGQAKIIGRIHCLQIVIGGVHCPASFTVLERSEGSHAVEFIFGLDLLRKLRCCIDLDKGVLRVNTEKSAEVPFIPDPGYTP